MLDQITILAEAGHEAAGGIPPAFIGIGAFVTLLVLLGITFLTAGQHQRGVDEDPAHHDH